MYFWEGLWQVHSLPADGKLYQGSDLNFPPHPPPPHHAKMTFIQKNDSRNLQNVCIIIHFRRIYTTINVRWSLTWNMALSI